MRYHEAAGTPIPPDVMPPSRTPQTEIWIGAFAELSTCRAYVPAPTKVPGLSMPYPEPIPWTALDAWARRHGIDDADAFALFVRAMRALDKIWLGRHPGPSA